MKLLIQFKRTTPTLFIPLAVICFGLAPMAQAVGPDTEGSIAGSNNGEGVGVLVSRASGVWNTGTGFEALNHLTSGNQNTATGLRALFSDINGGFNTATGVYSLYFNTSGFFNSATGAYSLTANTTGSSNTANGYSALNKNTTGADNNAIGLVRSIKIPPAPLTTQSVSRRSSTIAMHSTTTPLVIALSRPTWTAKKIMRWVMRP